MYAWADVSSTQANWVNSWQLTASGTGTFTFADGAEKYFPKGNEAIDIYAIHGRYQFAANAAFPSAGYTFAVHNDQRLEANYCESDLLYGIKKGVTYNAGGVGVKFYHMFSKVEVVLKADGALTDDDLAGAEVNILDVQTQVTFAPEKTTEAGIADSPTRENMLTLSTDQQAAKAAIIMNTVVAPKANTGFGTEVGEACIPPQSFDTDQFIKIVLHSADYNGTTLYVPLHNLEMHSGYKYTFQVSVNAVANVAASTVTVTPWGTETQNVIDMNVASEDRPVNVGDYLFSDGSWGPYTEGTATASHYPIAVIFSNTTSLTDQAAGYRRGYAVALASCGAQLIWAKTGTIGVNTQVHPTLTNSLELAKANLDGRTETNRIKTLSDFSKENYPAAYYATHFGTSDIGLTTGTGEISTEASGGSAGYAAPANTSGWYLGSIGQYYLVAKNLGGNIDTGTNNTWNVGGGTYWYISGSQANKNTLEDYFNAGSNTWAPAFGIPWSLNSYSSWYWTSSEFSELKSLLVKWNASEGVFEINANVTKDYYLGDTYNRGVRPVIAF